MAKPAKNPKCKACKACKALIEPRTGAKGFCATCYQRERRAAAGVGTLRAGEKVMPSPLTKPGARELRALCPPEVVKAFEKHTRRTGLSEADLVRQVLADAVSRFVVPPLEKILERPEGV